MITVQVWDRSLVKAVDKAIREAGLGLNPRPTASWSACRSRSSPRSAARNWPRRRTNTPKARVAVRNVRRDGMEQIKEQEKDRRRDRPGRAPRTGDRGPEADRRSTSSASTSAGGEGKGNPAGLIARCPVPPAEPRRWLRPGRRSEPPAAGAAHVAIIMDGNGRWAQARGLPRIAGHRAGRRRGPAHRSRRASRWASPG